MEDAVFYWVDCAASHLAVQELFSVLAEWFPFGSANFNERNDTIVERNS